MLEMRKLRFRKVKQIDQDHGVIKWYNQDLDPDLLGSRAQVLKFYINCISIDYNIENKSCIKRMYNCFVRQPSYQEVASSETWFGVNYELKYSSFFKEVHELLKIMGEK